MNILVTGGAGFIGSHLCERLLGEGHDVVSLDSFDDFYDPAEKESNLVRAGESSGFTSVRGDIRDADALAALPDGIDAVIHLAARAGVRPSLEQPALYTDVNVLGTVNVLEFARERGISRVLFGSSSSVYGNAERVPFSEDDRVDHPISPYAATKKACELICHSFHHLYGMGIVCLRFFTVYGPRQRPDLAIHKFARLLIAGESIPMFGDGTSERDYTYVDDILDGVTGALGYVDANPECFEVVNLGESRTVSLTEMIETVGAALGVTPVIERLPMQPGDVLRTYADVSKARRLFGYDPTTEFADGVARFVEWFRAR